MKCYYDIGSRPTYLYNSKEFHMLLLQQMLALFIFLLIGYYMRRKNILDASGSRAISWLIINVASPCMVVSGALGNSDPLSMQMLTRTLILCLLAYAALILCSLFLPTLLGIPKDLHNIYQVMTIFTNIGFMGFPLLRAMYGPGCLVYASIATVIFNLLFYTYGLRTMQKGSGRKVPLQITNVINPGTIACAVAIALALWRPPVPTFVETTVENLGTLPASLAMIVIGASLTEFRVEELFADKRDLLFSLIKQLVIPTIIIMVAKLFTGDPVLLGVLLIIVATPIGSMVVMAAQQYNANYKLAAKNVALSTILSVITMPIVAMVTNLN